LAVKFATSADNLKEIEKFKGSAFVIITSLLLFILCYGFFKKKADNESRLQVYRDTLMKSERAAAAGIFASSVAHDINNILFGLQNIEFGSNLSPEDLKDQNETYTLCIQKLTDLVSLLSNVRGSHLQNNPELFDLPSLIKDTIKMVKNHKILKSAQFELDIPAELTFSGIAIEIHQMLLNLLINSADSAVSHLKSKGQLKIKIVLKSKNNGPEPSVVIEIHDNGPGIPKEEKDHIFDPFYTTKSTGSGLGLVSVRACAEKHSGTISAGSSQLGGACFSIELTSLV
jgi:two-component system sensor histidine kinase HydH